MTETSEHAVVVATTPRTVFEHLRDPQRYVGLSPLVVAVHDMRGEALRQRLGAVRE